MPEIKAAIEVLIPPTMRPTDETDIPDQMARETDPDSPKST
jgi:hypothetical protein